jgi:Zn-dependent peptidase ImmA (M78 family)
MKRYNDLYSLARHLKKQFLPKAPVTVRRTKLASDTWGDCSYDGTTFKIRLHSRASEHSAIFFLLHEYAHILAWDKQQKDHGTQWGIAMSRVYCAYLEWIGEPEKRSPRAACLSNTSHGE